MAKKIFHLEDDSEIRNYVKKIAEDAGYEVSGFENLAGLSAGLAKETPDLLILDVMVDEADTGLIQYDELRKKLPKTPIIILTSLGEMIRPYFEQHQEMVCILEKPILPQKLISVIKSSLT